MSVEEELRNLVREIRDRLPLGQVAPYRLKSQPDGIELPLALATVAPMAPIDAFNFGLDFVKVWDPDVHHYTEGELLVQVDSVKPAAAFAYAAEVRVLGFVANVPDLLAVSAVNSASGPMVVAITRPYDRLLVEGRQLVNGVPNVAQAPGDGLLNISVQLRAAR